MNRTEIGKRTSEPATIEADWDGQDGRAMNEDAIGEVIAETHQHAGNEELVILFEWISLIKESAQSEESGEDGNEYSQAMAWNAEPEWLGESSEAEGETSGGSKEPEGYAD